jgi:hypothetical protein
MIAYLFFLLLFITSSTSVDNENLQNIVSSCQYQDLSEAVASLLCSVENGKYFISPSSSALQNAGCMIGETLFDYHK